MMEDPIKKTKYLKSFTIHVDGGPIYPKDQADVLEAELALLVGSDVIQKLHRYDTNPVNSPQPPGHAA